MAIERIKEFWPDWNVEEVLGKGSYGTVYKVRRDYMGTVSYSAVKEISIPTDLSEVRALRSEGMSIDDTKKYLEGIVMDFSNEIKLMDSLKSAGNVVSVEDFKVIEKENDIGWDIYIRMELLEPFENVMQAGRISEDEVIKLGIDLCTALEACQKFNIIHRDIKPANIFLSPFGDYKLGDFGVARELEKTVSNMSKKGTFTYMAPEVMRNEVYDHRADIYSLGIVMYTLLNNNHGPFLDSGTTTISYEDKKIALDRRMAGEMLPVPVGVTPDLAQIVLTACAFDVNRRFASPTALKNALKTYVANKANGTSNIAHTDRPEYPYDVESSGGYVPLTDDSDKTTRVNHPVSKSQDKTEVPVKKTKKSPLPIIILLAIILIGGAIAAFLILNPFATEDKNNTEEETTTVAEESNNGNDDDDGDIGGVSSSVSWKYKKGTLTISGTGAMNDYVYDNDKDTTNAPWVDYVDEIDTVVIKEGVTHIGKSAFENLPKLKNVTLPDGLESIGEGAFYKCEKLTSIKIPDTVTEIGGWAFSWCSSLSEVDTPENLEILGDCAFQGCTGLESIYLSNVVYRMGNTVFNECDGDLYIICPEGSYAETYAKDNGIKVEND